MSKTNNIWGFTSNFLKIVFISLILVGCSVTDNNGTPVWDGITIKTADDLVALSGKDVTENILFDADIDMKGKTFAGIKSFTGAIIDGNGKKILNLKIESDTDNAGLILSVPNGTTTEIKNLTIESGSIKTTALYGSAGAFIADSKGTVTLTGLTNKAFIDFLLAIGGSAGGMIGQAIGTVTIDNVKNTGDISGNDVGGMIGYAKTSSTVNINNANNSGSISGNDVGGMIGQAIGTVTIDNVKNTGDITTTGSGNNAGGMIGNANGNTSTVNINNANNSGSISGNDGGNDVGGMIGYASSTVTIKNTANIGAITSGNNAGGMIGRAASTYTINTSHSYTQRLVGGGTGTPTINNSYYLADTTGDGGLTATEFKDKDEFVGWDWTIWKMGTSYPELR